jgi:hypothetical protein
LWRRSETGDSCSSDPLAERILFDRLSHKRFFSAHRGHRSFGHDDRSASSHQRLRAASLLASSGLAAQPPAVATVLGLLSIDSFLEMA